MSSENNTPTIQNRKARHEYHIRETYEAGIVLKGTEVKSLREGKASLSEAYAIMKDGEVWLQEMYIKPYKQGSWSNHDKRRPRKLLLKKREIAELDKAFSRKGFALVPLKLYFKNGYAKILLGIAEGKKKYDKREDIKERDIKRDLEREYKGTHKIDL